MSNGYEGNYMGPLGLIAKQAKENLELKARIDLLQAEVNALYRQLRELEHVAYL